MIVRRITVVTCIAVFLWGFTEPALANDKQLQEAGDVSEWLVTAGALLYSEIVKDDREGLVEGGLSWAATAGTTQLLKATISSRRPDFMPGDPRDSFPSGHVTSAWSGAAYLRQRYGFREAWPAIVPAYALAITTAVSRVNADRHHVEDVVAGAVLSEVLATMLVGKYEDKAPGSRRIDLRGSSGIPAVRVVMNDDVRLGVMFEFRF